MKFGQTNSEEKLCSLQENSQKPVWLNEMKIVAEQPMYQNCASLYLYTLCLVI
jgi:hypothetical protein